MYVCIAPSINSHGNGKNGSHLFGRMDSLAVLAGSTNYIVDRKNKIVYFFDINLNRNVTHTLK